MSTKPRKPTGSFVSDAANFVQSSPSPRVERSPYTMANHNSKTNFIGDSVLPEGPRAVAVSETGEKHSIFLEDDCLKTNTNPFSILPTQASNAPTTLCQHNSSSSKIPNIAGAGGDRPRLNSVKRSKVSRRYNNQKTRPVFTPRNMEKMTPRTCSEERKMKTLNLHAETQTESHSNSTTTNITTTTNTTVPTTIPTSPPSSRLYHHIPMPSLPTTPPMQLPQRRFVRENMGDMLDSPRRQPIRILPRKKSPMKNFSELRSIASALTLITVVSWLFSTFFELEGIIEIFGQLMQTLQNWIGRKEQPVTKAEMLVQYVRNIWS